MSVSVVVPFRGDGAERTRNWAWNRQRWLTLGCELVEEGGTAGGGRFAHSASLNRAVERAAGDTLVIADADIAIAPDWVREAVQIVESGEAPWVLASTYVQLTEDASRDLALLSPLEPISEPFEGDVVWRGEGVSYAPPLVVSRAGFEAVGGYDERFGSWGADDLVLGAALDTLAGPVRRLEGVAYHLWHPRAGLDAQPPDQHALMQRYLDAHHQPAPMRELLQERP